MHSHIDSQESKGKVEEVDGDLSSGGCLWTSLTWKFDGKPQRHHRDMPFDLRTQMFTDPLGLGLSLCLSAALQSLWSSNSSRPRLGIGRANKAAPRSILRTRGFDEGKWSNRDQPIAPRGFPASLPYPPLPTTSEIGSINNDEWSTVAAKIRAKLVNRELWIDRGQLDPYFSLTRRWFLSQSFV